MLLFYLILVAYCDMNFYISFLNIKLLKHKLSHVIKSPSYYVHILDVFNLDRYLNQQVCVSFFHKPQIMYLTMLPL